MNVAGALLVLRISRIFGVHLGSGPSSNEMRNFVGVIAVLLDGVGGRIHVHVLVDDEFLARIGLFAIDFQRSACRSWATRAIRIISPSPSRSMSWPGSTVPRACREVGIAGPVPDIPERGVFFAQPPQGKSLQAQFAGGAHLVEQRLPRRGTTPRGAGCCPHRCIQSAD